MHVIKLFSAVFISVLLSGCGMKSLYEAKSASPEFTQAVSNNSKFSVAKFETNTPSATLDHAGMFFVSNAALKSLTRNR